MTADCCAPRRQGNHYDLVILGSGSTAFAAALTAQEMGKTAVMVEERTIGGTCVNRGCLPSKNLIEAAKLVFDARNPRYPGLETCGLGLKVDFGALIAQKDELIRVYREKKYDSLVGGQFGIEEGHARFLDAYTVEVSGKHLTGERFLIATGSRPVIPENSRACRGAVSDQRSPHSRRGRGANGAACLAADRRRRLHRP